MAHLPAGGEIVLFDRSWYNRAGVERIMGFASPDQVEQFFRDVPEFDRMLVRSDIKLVKYWFSITDQEQQFRFLMRIHDPIKQWKLSPMDLQSRTRWEHYTKAKEEMFERTNIPEAPTARCRTSRSTCRIGCSNPTTSGRCCRTISMCQRCTEPAASPQPSARAVPQPLTSMSH
jgi:polyphosphate kinase 2 (PPK2 family)